MLVFNRREFLITGGLAGAAVFLPGWLKRQSEANAAVTMVGAAAPVSDQEWVFGLAFPAYFPVLPAVIDPTATPTPVASTTPTATATAAASPTATSTPTMTPTPTATPDPLNNKIYLPIVVKETIP